MSRRLKSSGDRFWAPEVESAAIGPGGVHLVFGLRTILTLLSAVIFLLGSWVYVAVPALSGANLLSAVLFPVLLWTLLKARLPNEGFLSLLACSTFMAVVAVAVAMSPGEGNVRMARAALVSGSAIYWGAWLAKRRPTVTLLAVEVSLIVAVAIALAQIAYVRSGVGINPAIEGADFDFEVSRWQEAGYPSIFTNPNDFSVFACLVFLIFAFRVGRAAFFFRFLAFCAVLLSGSKIAVLIVLFALLMRTAKGWAVWAGVAAALACIFMVGLYADKLATGYYGIDRLLVTLGEVLRGELDAGSSAALRFAAHSFFVEHYFTFLVGSFESGVPFPQFVGADFDVGLMSVNPHSLIIEAHALYGAFGLLIVGLWGAALLLTLSRSYSKPLVVYLLASVVSLSSVPSSVFHIGSFFALVTILAVMRPDTRWRAVRQVSRPAV